MATITRGKTFISGETVEPADMHQLVESATVTDIVNADIASNAAIAGSKLAAGGVTDVQLAAGAVTGAAGGGKIAASAITGQTQLADPLASGDEFLVHDTSASALRRVAWSALQPAGTVVQTQSEIKSAWETLTHSTNWGEPANETTLPSSTAGVEVISKSIQPASTSNKVLVSVNIPAMTTAAGYWQMVLFRDTTAIQADTGYSSGTDALNRGGFSAPTTLLVVDSPNTQSSTTYSVRVARTASASGTFYLNGISTAQRGGGVYKASLTLQEIKG